MCILLGVVDKNSKTTLLFRKRTSEFSCVLTMPEKRIGQTLTEQKTRCYSAPSPGRRSVRRPEDIQRDVRGLKLRQRVTVVLNDDFVRHELEDTLGKHGDTVEEVESVRAYQDFLVPSNNFYGAMPGVAAVHPINDIRGSDTLNYTKSERNLRCKLAATYRLVDLFGWSQNIHGNLTVRCPPEHGRGDNFLIKPLDLLYNEVSASTLVKVDAEGNILDGGSTNFGVDVDGFFLHSAIHMPRKDAKCIIHIHEPSVAAVAASKHGVLPISHASLIIAPVSYHDYEGISCEEGEKGRLETNFQAGSKVLVLRNHGLVCAGETIEEALFYTDNAIKACKIQVQALSAGIENLTLLDKELLNKIREASGKDNVGVKEFEAWMRMLDSQGYRTGYVYHTPDLYNKSVQQPKSDARSPATMSSLRYEMVYGDNQNTPTRRAHTRGKGNTYKNRAKWLNTPVKGTEYKKEIIHDNHSETTILKDSQTEKETVVKISKESKNPKENMIQENISSEKSERVMNEIPLENIFNNEDSAFIEKGSNDAEMKEIKPIEVTTTEVTTIEVRPDDDGTITKQVVTTTSVVKGDDPPVTTVEEKKVIVDGNEDEVDTNMLSASVEVEVEEKADEGSDDGGEKEKNGDKAEAEGGKHEHKGKKKKSFKKTFQGMMHRKSKADKDEDEEKS